MPYRTDDIRIKEIKELVPPSHVLREFPVSDKAARTVYETRQVIHRILHGADDRLLVIMGPCSIHDVKAAKEYAGKLKREREKLADDLLVVMRVYFEKPRTTVGWKGLINDPNLDGSFRINEGLRVARRQARFGEALAGGVYACRVIVRRLAAAQDDVAILVAGGGDDRAVAGLGDR